MVVITVSFTLAFAVESEKPKKEKKERKNVVGKKSKNKLKSSSSKSVKASKKAKKQQPPKPDYVLEVKKPLGFAHIEYELVPEKTFTVDIACWDKFFQVSTLKNELGKITFRQVFLLDMTKIVTTVPKGNLVWTAFTIAHKLNSFSDEELFMLHEHVINYTIYTSKGKFPYV